MNVLSRTCRSLRPRWPKNRLALTSVFSSAFPVLSSGSATTTSKSFGVNAHSSHRFGLSARTAPALTSRLPFPSGCVLHLCLLDSKAVIFASHKLHSRCAWRTIAFSRGFAGARTGWQCRGTDIMQVLFGGGMAAFGAENSIERTSGQDFRSKLPAESNGFKETATVSGTPVFSP